MLERTGLRGTYILPIRAETAAGADELACYLRSLEGMQVVVVDGSTQRVFAAFENALSGIALHIPPDPRIAGANGKVRGVLTGLVFAQSENIVVADDDVRYEKDSLLRILALLEKADVVRPQNFFRPAPWHALLDASRTLINRALDGDWPGTLAFRRSLLPRGFNPDVLFENYELVRTVRARGGTEIVARSLYVCRLPPTARHYLGQRVRQAYDEFARPLRLAVALAVLPTLVAACALHVWLYPLVLLASSIALAAFGWARDGGYRYFSFVSVAIAPAWVIERAICAWLAVFERIRFGGVRYAGSIIAKAASTDKEIATTWAA